MGKDVTQAIGSTARPVIASLEIEAECERCGGLVPATVNLEAGPVQWSEDRKHVIVELRSTAVLVSAQAAAEHDCALTSE